MLKQLPTQLLLQMLMHKPPPNQQLKLNNQLYQPVPLKLMPYKLLKLPHKLHPMPKLQLPRPLVPPPVHKLLLMQPTKLGSIKIIHRKPVIKLQLMLKLQLMPIARLNQMLMHQLELPLMPPLLLRLHLMQLLLPKLLPPQPHQLLQLPMPQPKPQLKLQV